MATIACLPSRRVMIPFITRGMITSFIIRYWL